MKKQEKSKILFHLAVSTFITILAIHLFICYRMGNFTDENFNKNFNGNLTSYFQFIDDIPGTWYLIIMTLIIGECIYIMMVKTTSDEMPWPITKIISLVMGFFVVLVSPAFIIIDFSEIFSEILKWMRENLVHTLGVFVLWAIIIASIVGFFWINYKVYKMRCEK